MRLQRVGIAESLAECSLLNGPLRAQSKGFRVFCEVKAYVSCREYVGIPQRVWATINQGGTTVMF